jgi:hypothetical protein
MGLSGQHHAPAVLYPGKRAPGTHWIRGWVGPRAGLDAGARRKILCLCRGLNPVRPVRSQSLYWLSYRGSPQSTTIKPQNKYSLTNVSSHDTSFIWWEACSYFRCKTVRNSFGKTWNSVPVVEALHMPADVEFVTRLAYTARVSQAFWTLDYCAGNLPRRKVSHVTTSCMVNVWGWFYIRERQSTAT